MEDEEIYIELNPSILREAKGIVNGLDASDILEPIGIPGFEGFYVAPLASELVDGLAILQSTSGVRYKVGFLSKKKLN